ncbi:bifunctional riboflavin kinase/FAD synthetase [Butyrivibrio sp. YAB3001]|uniref:bifunctional riboflavin kinase/FAD synthetase n=1 Tax=Butyrivibrio sp. YAB3001 TaxID=1520812 RepID=UPI0008F66CF5|nr:bifunctional riboflavin kinase/FAD synthetase [Butyrivibrio sp. YAB3001]SFC92658.1 riboflavin kinase / FMN adenylyltransferase [Butyrivibrio sp. YAB3001]
MQIITRLDELNIQDKTAIAIGKFDGIHLGHKKLLKYITDQKQDGLKATVFTFEPSPEEFFVGHPVRQLFTRNEKRKAFEELGIDILVEFPLTLETAATPPEDFVKMILVEDLKADFIAAGTDVSFGDKGRGDQYLLKNLSKELGFELCLIDKVMLDGEEVSSTRVRNQVADGNMPMVTRLLGNDYCVCGIVEHGRQLGRTIGIPTVNILPSANKLLPPFGVYSSIVKIDGKEYNGMTNIGRKPTVSSSNQVGVETYLYDFNEDVYGKMIEVRLKKFVRPEMKFDSIEQLKAQIENDLEAAIR